MNKLLEIYNIKPKTELPVNTQSGIDGQTAKVIDSVEDPYDKKAKQSGWFILINGEAYMKQVSVGSIVFIEKQMKGWNAWRETWGKDDPRSQSVKTLVSGGSFESALTKANEYTSYFNKPKRVK
ncbi:hypothetical protein [Ammoniphilus resinae]|uniref:Uncharacterized protein n=1 Tax=Ammoniphilus resinae TaxID=861532 RepID=A0ABS4GXB3_9BACL|nr:hypothetical protein [Ammoniphilus resinae]MBP1934886.1 hypothetical protein [Ammoniphilus resinae]